MSAATTNDRTVETNGESDRLTEALEGRLSQQSFVVTLGSRSQNCSPIPCRSCSRVPASVARVPASKGRAHDTLQSVTL